ncbi:MCP four helix bundle domain-containing protein [Herbaspirillum sp. LeCh32-8]|uniref:methyl-accepting chemotaxis protein n=1 Tax=Herbaspirillum sp. LeCh32-8 TaxID=2821356 RepID=UPI001AE32750|nr:methyl-accepting chemotaxis protein [Herbaspirillum sp. LeCh32-8]MBP0599871.1 MCP four helix bundle domain-containing protein [Herbaspirillum sp. LeCh32-8]
MRWFYDLRISLKLALTFFLLLLLTCVLGVFSLLQIQKVNQSSRYMAENLLPGVQASLEIEVALSRARANQMLRLTSTSRDDGDRYGKMFDEQIALVDDAIKRSVSLADMPEEKVNVTRVRNAFDKYKGIHERVVSAYQHGQPEEGLRLVRGEAGRLFNDVFDSASTLVRINVQGSKDADQRAESIYRTAQVMIAALLVASLLLGALLATWLARIVGAPLQQAVQVAGSVARGDLTVDIVAASKDESGQLMASLKDMNTSLLRVVTRVRRGTDTIATAADQIASGNADLSQRTEQQSGSLEETVSSIEQLTATVGKNADNAREASRLAASASKVAQEGGAVVSQVVDTMESINDSSQKVADIVSVIDGIAFQTNILALNAAVEAARAGEQGRGFAVVASEVRSLAQRSSSAAKEIKTLIGDSVKRVESGSRLVAQAGATMADIVASVRQVSQIVDEIAQASQEQSSGIAGVNAAIARIDETTSQNAALVEQAAAAAQSLKEQAVQLTEVVGTFKLDAVGGREAAFASAPALPLHRASVPALRNEAHKRTPDELDREPS